MTDRADGSVVLTHRFYFFGRVITNDCVHALNHLPVFHRELQMVVPC